MRHLRVVAAATSIVLCGLITACAGSPAPAVSPSVAPEPSMKTAPTSSLCAALDLSAAQTVSAALQASPRVAVDQADTADACNYASADGGALLTLAPAMRSYDEELALARTLARDPASSGMRDVRVQEAEGIGQAAFSESGYVLQQQQNLAYVVWRSGARAWVLTLAEVAHTNNSDRLGSVARQIAPRLPR